MKNLVHAELLKLRTTRSFYGNAVAVMAFVPLLVAVAVQTAGGDGGGAPLDTSEGVRNVLAAAGSGTAMVNIIGIMIMAGEFRHSTAVPTFLVTPDRRQVVGAKLIAVTVVGLGLAVMASILTLAIAVPWLAAKGVTVDIFSADVALVLLGAGAATVLYGLIGVGMGSLVRNQTAAIIATLLWVLVVENSLVSFAPQVGRWVPSGASNALTSVAAPSGELLPAWGGGLVLLAYGLAFAAAGVRFAVRRDVA